MSKTVSGRILNLQGAKKRVEREKPEKEVGEREEE